MGLSRLLLLHLDLARLEDILVGEESVNFTDSFQFVLFLFFDDRRRLNRSWLIADVGHCRLNLVPLPVRDRWHLL